MAKKTSLYAVLLVLIEYERYSRFIVVSYVESLSSLILGNETKAKQSRVSRLDLSSTDFNKSNEIGTFGW